MLTIDDFDNCGFVNIRRPQQGYIRYLLRTGNDKNEDVSLNIELTKAGEISCNPFPCTIERRETMKRQYIEKIREYSESFIGTIFYVQESYRQEFERLCLGDKSEAMAFWKEFLYDFYDRAIGLQEEGYQLVYAATHMRQLCNGNLQQPHIHMLFGKPVRQTSK